MHLAVTAALALAAPPERALCEGPACPIVRFTVRSNPVLERVLTGGQSSLVRIQPELFMGFRPTEAFTFLAGGGAGPTYIRNGGSHDRVGFTSSGALGARVVLDGTWMLAIARVEALMGRPVAFTLELRVTFGP